MASEKEREVDEERTRSLIADQIHQFEQKSREAGRSEHFLSGLSAAYAIAIGVYNTSDPDEAQETLF
jgi:hypothetical protein